MIRGARRHLRAASTLALVAALLPAGAMAEPDLDSVQTAVDAWRGEREQAIVQDFIDLLALPNVAANLPDMTRNAAHIVRLLEARGFSTRTLSAGGAPYVFAELNAPRASETLLVYAHFDGQPVQAENWAYPPFSPTLLSGELGAGGEPVDVNAVDGRFQPDWRLYARSAGDDKMPIIALLHTLDALRANGIPLSVNLKLLLDGEEEAGSPTVGRLIEEHRALLDADLLLFCDGPMHPSGRTQIVFGVRGAVTVDVTTYGAARPLHSGHYGNWAPNPIMQLAHLLASMRDPSGRILIDGYDDHVVPLSAGERAAIAAMPDNSRALRDELAVHTPEGGGARLEALVARPALNVRGIEAGGVGAQGRNVIVSSATASLDLRLVPAQTPAGVRERLEEHIASQGFHVIHDTPSGATLRGHDKVARLRWGAGYPALRTPLDQPMAARLTALLRRMAPDLIVTPSLGGSLPLHEFGSRLDAPIVILPLANHDNNQHAENENIRLGNLWHAMRVYGAVLAAFGTTDGYNPPSET